MLFYLGMGRVADLPPAQRQGHLTQTAVQKGTPPSALGNVAPFLGREGLWLAMGVPLPILQESVELGGGHQPSTLCPYKAWQSQGLILAPEAPAGQGAR